MFYNTVIVILNTEIKQYKYYVMISDANPWVSLYFLNCYKLIELCFSIYMNLKYTLSHSKELLTGIRAYFFKIFKTHVFTKYLCLNQCETYPDIWSFVF